MKKWLIGLLLLAALAIGAEFYFIPSQLHIASSQYVKCNSRPAADLLLIGSNWKKWWNNTSGDTIQSNHSLSFYLNKKKPYQLDNDKNAETGFQGNYAAEVMIRDDKHTPVSSVVNIILYKKDSTGIEWKCDLKAGNNPFYRIVNYYRALKIKKSMDELIDAFAGFSGVGKNIYGVEIDKRKFKDTFMISTQTTVSTTPDDKLIYQVIDKLILYATSKGAHSIDPPMMNVDSTLPGVYTLKVAIPINKEIPSSDAYRFRFMIQGNTLFAPVNGGPKTIAKAIQQMRLYVSDFGYSSPAIPFESMVTDRMKVTDTSKWLTHVFYPVM